jgi:hypothetical protein
MTDTPDDKNGVMDLVDELLLGGLDKSPEELIAEAVTNGKAPPEDPVGNILLISDYLSREKKIKEEAKKHGVPKSVLREEIKKRTKKGNNGANGEHKAPPKPTTEELTKSAADIIASTDVLKLFEASWAKVMAGEQRNAKLLYLMATTRIFDRCMSCAIKGPSSAGKSEVRERVLDFMPPEDVISFTTLSEKSLLYVEGDFSHKILSLGEASGADEVSLQDYLLRELISSGKLIYPVPQKVGGEIITITIVKNGPVCFFVTTTRATLHPENETRLVSIEVDDSPEQTAAVLGKVAEIVGMNAEASAIDYGPWLSYQRWLATGNTKVVVPFAQELGRLIPPRAVRLRRDFPQILIAIKAHALLHRLHRKTDNRGQIVADLELDYVPVAELMGGIVSEASGTSVSKALQATINAVTEATSGLAVDDGATSDKIAKLLKLDQSAAWRRLNVAMRKGYVVNMETRHRQPGRYRVTAQGVEKEPLLPSTEKIRAQEGPKSTHTCIRPPKDVENQEGNVCKPDLHTQPVCMHTDPVCEPYANDLAYANPVENNEESLPYARMHENQGGERAFLCARCGGEDDLGNPVWFEAALGVHLHAKCREGYEPEKEVEDDIGDIPEFLRRKPKEGSDDTQG